MITLRGRTVVPGVAAGEALVSHEPISGWGGIDPARGVIIEPRHELSGQCFTGKILVFPSAKGSSGWSSFFQSTRLLGTAPLGMVIASISTKSALGAVVTRVPTVTALDADPCAVISTGDWVRVDGDNGVVEVTLPHRPGPVTPQPPGRTPHEARQGRSAVSRTSGTTCVPAARTRLPKPAKRPRGEADKPVHRYPAGRIKLAGRRCPGAAETRPAG